MVIYKVDMCSKPASRDALLSNIKESFMQPKVELKSDVQQNLDRYGDKADLEAYQNKISKINMDIYKSYKQFLDTLDAEKIDVQTFGKTGKTGANPKFLLSSLVAKFEKAKKYFKI